MNSKWQIKQNQISESRAKILKTEAANKFEEFQNKYVHFGNGSSSLQSENSGFNQAI